MGFLQAIFRVISFDFVLLMGACVLGYFYYYWRTEAGRLENFNAHLQEELHETEEQTRLIIKTDHELSQAQEANDRKLKCFKSLQRISHQLSSILEEDMVYGVLNQDVIRDLGFGALIIFMFENDGIEIKKTVNFPVPEEDIQELLSENSFKEDLSVFRLIDSSNEKSVPQPLRLFLSRQARLSNYQICALKAKGEMFGGMILGGMDNASHDGTREVAEVFVTHIAQTLDNIRMFEKIYKSQQELEMRVKERTTDLQRALTDVESAHKRKTEFVSAVSHEFRTPLTSIKGYASLLAGGKFGDLPDGIRTRLLRINEQADALVAMINDLLDIARIESGRVSISLTRLDLAELIRAEADMFYPQLKEKNLTLRTDLPESANLDVDKQLISRVLINLISNAVKFTPSGRTVTVILKEEPAKYRLCVKDEGIGIPAVDLENVFKEFFRVDTAEHRDVKGTGLGLSLVANIVRAHKGDIWVESDMGQGAEFIILLPKQLQLESGAEIVI